MATTKKTTDALDAAEKAIEPELKTYELGGVTWKVHTPIPGLLTLKLGKAVEADKGQNGVFLDIMYAAIGEEQREDFDNRMMAPPTVDTDEIVKFVSWLIEESSSAPLEEF